MSTGGRFDFEDGGTYCGGWLDGKAHGMGVCTGPKGQGEFAGYWEFGFEQSGIYTWPSGNCYQGQWTQGKRHGVGVEDKNKWTYKGEWTHGFKGRYGCRSSDNCGAKYEGTWTTGLQDGYGVETYSDSGVYKGQWLRGMRHGYGMRQSVPYGLAASHCTDGKIALRSSVTSLKSIVDQEMAENRRPTDEIRGGFVLKGRSIPGDESPASSRRFATVLPTKEKHQQQQHSKFTDIFFKKPKKKPTKIQRHHRSTGDIDGANNKKGWSMRSQRSNYSSESVPVSNNYNDDLEATVASAAAAEETGSQPSLLSNDDLDTNTVETYIGEWKNDKRAGFGVSYRTDGLKYEGEWLNNTKHGYGVTTLRDGTTECGKYKNNMLISSTHSRSKIFILWSNKLKDRVENAVAAAQRAAQIATQKSDIAVTRMANARAKAAEAERAAVKAQNDSDKARLRAKEVAPEFNQPGMEILKRKMTGSLPNNISSSGVSNIAINNGGGNSNSTNVNTNTNSSSINNPGSGNLVPNNISGGGSGIPKISVSSNQLVVPHQQQQQLQQSQPPPKQISEDYNLNTTTSKHKTIVNALRLSKQQLPINETVVADHFDQYETASGYDVDSLGRSMEAMSTRPNSRAQSRSRSRGVSEERRGAGGGGGNSSISSSQERYQQQQQFLLNRANNTINYNNNDNSNIINNNNKYINSSNEWADSLDGLGGMQKKTRRLTLPSIMKKTEEVVAKKTNIKLTNFMDIRNKRNTNNINNNNNNNNNINTNTNTSINNAKTYLIDDGKRKIVKEERLDTEGTFKLKIEPVFNDIKGSLPDVHAQSRIELMPREEAYKLSTHRREQIRIMKEEEERRRRQEIVLSFGALKDWLMQQKFLMFFIAINVSLASLFFRLLS